MRWSGRFAGYHWGAFRQDLISGLIVGVIAIPLGMAFAIASGVEPEYGIYTTIVAGICISLFGGSKFQIGGPTGAFIPVLLAVVLQYGYHHLLVAGFMAGVMLVLMGVFRLGSLIRYIPRPVTIGFTAGIAVIIFSGQIANYLGLTGIEKHEQFLLNMRELLLHISAVNVYSVITATVGLAVMLVAPKWFPKVPGSLLGLIAASAVAHLLFRGKVATIGSTYGDIPASLPSFAFPDITWDTIVMLLPSAFVIAMLGGIESLLSAVVADSMAGTRHNSNRELIGQGIANIVTPMFGGIPATGAIARTATNIKSGAASPLSGVIHGVFVLVVLIAFAPYASQIPLAAMAPILMVVAWNMSERKHFIQLLKMKTTDSLVMLFTFLLTVLTDLSTAVVVGLVLASILFVKKMADASKAAKVLPDRRLSHHKVSAHAVTETRDCPQFHIYTLEGPLFFAASNAWEKVMQDIRERRPSILLLRMSKVPLVDTTGAENLASVIRPFMEGGGQVICSGLQPQPMQMLKKIGILDQIGADRCFERTGQAIDWAMARLDADKCKGCRHFAFLECAGLSGEAPGLTSDERAASEAGAGSAAASSPVPILPTRF